MINLKTIECQPDGCGTVFTISSNINSNAHEHFAECIKKNWQYREAIIEKLDNIIIIKCPECKKEVIRQWS